MPKSLAPVDLGFQQLLGIRFENRASAPSNPTNGVTYFDTTAGTYRLFQAGAWFELAPGGVLVGLLSARPAATVAAKGQTYYATDTAGLLYVDTGGSWVSIGGSSGAVGPHGHVADDLTGVVAGVNGTKRLFLSSVKPDDSLGENGDIAIPDVAASGSVLGVNNTSVVEVPGLLQQVDTRNQVLAYAGGKLSQVQDRNGTTVIKTTTLNYTGNLLTSTVEVVGGKTITTTMNYTGSDLTSVTRVVV